MLRPEGKTDRTPTVIVEELPKETPVEEVRFHLVNHASNLYSCSVTNGLLSFYYIANIVLFVWLVVVSNEMAEEKVE